MPKPVPILEGKDATKHSLTSNHKKLPMKLPIPEEEMLNSLKRGLRLQLWNGFLHRQINLRSRKRIFRKIKTILGR